MIKPKKIQKKAWLIILNGKLYDAYHQSWVATPEADYVRAGARPLQAKLEELEGLVQELSPDHRALLQNLGLTDADGKITPYELTKERLDNLWSEADYNEMYSMAEGDITIEELEYSLYMASEYGFQILNGNNAAKVYDYRTHGAIMNDFAETIFLEYFKSRFRGSTLGGDPRNEIFRIFLAFRENFAAAKSRLIDKFLGDVYFHSKFIRSFNHLFCQEKKVSRARTAHRGD